MYGPIRAKAEAVKVAVSQFLKYKYPHIIAPYLLCTSIVHRPTHHTTVVQKLEHQ